MSSTEKNNTESTTKISTEPALCSVCKQFYGNAIFDNLCSKCFKDRQKAQGLTVTKPTETTQTTNNNDTSSQTQIKTEEEKKEEQKPKQEDKNKCWSCQKKTGIMGYECKCGYVFCKNHRLPEEHDCTFDFAKRDRERLAAANPLIAGSKLDKV